jgi:hypothetical protein
VRASVAQLADHTGLTLTLARHRVAELAGGAQRKALAGQALCRRPVRRLVMVVLTPARPRPLVAVRIEPVGHVTLARATDGVAPPGGGARLLQPLLTVSTALQRAGALTAVAVPLRSVLGTGGVVAARVQLAHIVAAGANITGSTAAFVGVPAGGTLGCRRAGAARTGVRCGAARLHTALQGGAEVGIRHPANPHVL